MSDQYTILSTVDVAVLSVVDLNQLYSQVQENSFATTRRSLDGTKMILKWIGDSPCEALNLVHTGYSYKDILPVLTGAEWVRDIMP